MGQSAIGLMYGCRLPEDIDFYGNNGPDLISEFQGAIEWKYDSKFRPVSIEGVDDVPVIGVLVAVSGSGENGAADLWPTRRFADIVSLPEVDKARETWDRFVLWCSEHRVEIRSNPELWFVTTETA